MTLKGNTREFPLDVLLRLLGDTRKTGELSLRADHGEGALGLAEGRVVTAVFGDEAAIPALGSVFEMKEADFEFTPWNDPPSANLEGELGELLQKAKEYRDWLASVREVVPSDRTRFRLSERAAEQGVVTFTPERWRVVLAVNGQRNVTDIATHLRIDRDNALGILSGLVRDGVIDTVEPASVDAAPPAPSPPPAAEMRSRASATMETPPPAPAPTPEPEPEPPAAAMPEPIAESRPEPMFTESPPEPMFTEPAPSPTPMAPPEPPRWEAPPNQWGGFSNAPAPAPAPSATETSLPSDWSSLPAPAPHTPEPYVPAPSDWSAMPAAAPAPEQRAPEPPPPPADWGAAPSAAPAPVEPAPAPAPNDWSVPASSSVDDRLASIFGESTAPAAPSAPAAPRAAEGDWGAPAKNDWATPAAAPAPATWSAPAPAQAAPEIDPRLAALTMPAPAEPPAPAPAAAKSMPAAPAMNEAAQAEAPAKKKGGLFGGLFGGGSKQQQQQQKTAAPTAAAMPAASGRSRAGRLAAFANALLAEYASGQYGKGKIDDRMASLLMRVDEQADPIDRPLPVVDDRLDVEALERVSIADAQASPYLAMLVSTIYADAEKAFGKDKAKRGYKSAQQQVLGSDTSSLTGADLAGKLPKV